MWEDDSNQDNLESTKQVKLTFPEIKKVDDKENEEFNKKSDNFEKEYDKDRKNNSDIVLYDVEKILLFSQPKAGKTWAVCSYIEEVIKRGGTVYYLNTEMGFYRTFDAYFKSKDIPQFREYFKTKDKSKLQKYIKFYFINDLKELDNNVKEIKDNSKKEDLVVIDLINDIYEKAQTRFVTDVCSALGISLIDYIITSSRESQKFGLFDSNKWSYIKKFDEIVLQNLVIESKCDVIGCCASKDLEVRMMYARKDKDTEKINVLNKYEEVGCKPAGHESLPGKFHTVIYIGENINSKKFFVVIGDRGTVSTKKKFEYQDNFYNTFREFRK